MSVDLLGRAAAAIVESRKRRAQGHRCKTCGFGYPAAIPACPQCGAQTDPDGDGDTDVPSGGGPVLESVLGGAWDEALHPRGRRGEWVAKLGRIKDFGHVDLPHGGTIHKLSARKFAYQPTGLGYGDRREFDTAEKAVDAAIPDIERWQTGMTDKAAQERARFEHEGVKVPGTNQLVIPSPGRAGDIATKLKKLTGKDVPGLRTKASDYLDEKVDYGGEKMSRGAVIQDFVARGFTQKDAERWLQGNDLGRARERRESRAAQTAADSKKDFPSGTTLSERVVPDSWKVANGYGEWKNPDTRNGVEGDRVAVMPNHPEHGGETGVITKKAYSANTSPMTRVDVKLDSGKDVTFGNNEIHSASPASRGPWVLTKPGTNVEHMIYHYMTGHAPVTKYPPGTKGFEQWSYGMLKKFGGTPRPAKAADREALLRKITQAVTLERGGELELAERALVEAFDLAEAMVGSSWDPALHPRVRGGRFGEVLAHLRMNGSHTLGHGVSVHKGMIGYRVEYTGHQKRGFMEPESAVRHAIQLFDNEARRSEPKRFMARYSPGTAETVRHAERWESLQPGSAVQLHSPHAMDVASHALDQVGQHGEARHVAATGEIRHANLTDAHLGVVERALASAGHHTSASLVHRELSARRERDAGRVAATHTLGLEPGGVSKAQAMVDAGLADDLRDARAQLADMGETNSLLSPGSATGSQQRVLDYLASRPAGIAVRIPPGVASDRRTFDALVASGKLERGEHPDTFRLGSGGRGGAAGAALRDYPAQARHRRHQADRADAHAAELHAQGNHEHAADYEEMARSYRARAAEFDAMGATRQSPGEGVRGKLAELKKNDFTRDREFDLTNHYIDRPDHPKFGTRRVSVQFHNSGSLYVHGPDGKTEQIQWPKASQVERMPDGTIHFYGGGAAQKPDDLFLTFKPV